MSADFPGQTVYVKPRTVLPGKYAAIAAREKIASDLAHDLGVHVPPAVLAHSRQLGHERRVVLSLLLYGNELAWADVKHRISGRTQPAGKLDIGALARGVAPRDAADAFVFDWWLAQPDHGEHNPSNIVFGAASDGTRPAFLFFDYEKAMGAIDAMWPEISQPPPFPKSLLALIDPVAAREAASRIQSLADKEVMGVVSRIPPDYITPEDREQISGNLMLRKQQMAQIIDRFFTEATP